MTRNEMLLCEVKHYPLAAWLRAIAALSDGEVPSGNFKPPRNWELVVGKERFAHRQVVAMLLEREAGRLLNGGDFEGDGKEFKAFFKRRFGWRSRRLARVG